MRCPICEREFDPAGPTAARPFCSSRCRTIDLGRWLGEGYSLASDGEVDPADRPEEGANGQAAPGEGD